MSLDFAPCAAVDPAVGPVVGPVVGPDRLAGVLARLDAYPRSVPELLEVVPELICELVGVLHGECRDHVHEIDGEALEAFTASLQAALARCVLRDQLLATRQRLQQLALELRAVPAGTGPPPHRVPAAAARRLRGATRNGLPSTLTRRELEVLGLMADGCTNAAIAERLMIADGTAKKHVVRVLSKLGATNRSEAVSRWFRAGGVGALPTQE
jgi:DNA-binding CsgD family transcriptional regulator